MQRLAPRRFNRRSVGRDGLDGHVAEVLGFAFDRRDDVPERVAARRRFVRHRARRLPRGLAALVVRVEFAAVIVGGFLPLCRFGAAVADFAFHLRLGLLRFSALPQKPTLRLPKPHMPRKARRLRAGGPETGERLPFRQAQTSLLRHGEPRFGDGMSHRNNLRVDSRIHVAFERSHLRGGGNKFGLQPCHVDGQPFRFRLGGALCPPQP
mmetsp:Transcript_24566/g.84073  ORF Transcript_24566/g.84073 Transcript_24566/m.84073 type:complete len:209 (-) Transcript_24566:821-1447(-)